MRFSVSGALLDDWANGGYADVLFTCGECSSFGSWSCSEEKVWLSDKKYIIIV